jgi:hypothetical protein
MYTWTSKRFLNDMFTVTLHTDIQTYRHTDIHVQTQKKTPTPVTKPNGRNPTL